MSLRLKHFARKSPKAHHKHGGGTWLGRKLRTGFMLFGFSVLALNLAGIGDAHLAGYKVNNMSPQEITSLSFEESAALLSRMSAMGNVNAPWLNETSSLPLIAAKVIPTLVVFPKETAALLQRATGIDPEFRDYYAENRADFDDYLATSPIIKKARAGWDKASDEVRFAWLNKIAADHSDIMGFKKPKMRMLKKDILVGKNTNAYFTPYIKRITLIADAKRGWDEFDRIVPTLIHENTHSHQNQLLNQFLNGDIKKPDPRYGQAAVFAAGMSSAAKHTDAYHSNPTERHAFWVMKNHIKHFPNFPEYLKIDFFGASYGIDRVTHKKTLSETDIKRYTESYVNYKVQKALSKNKKSASTTSLKSKR